MGPRFGMFQQQSAAMRMTPQLRQALKILQLSAPELLDVVRQELQENPMLECKEDVWKYGDSGGIGIRGDHYDALHHTVASLDASLERHLREQLNFMKDIPHRVRTTIAYLIGNLDDNGYLELSIDEIAETLQTDPGIVEEAHSILQGFDPAGVAARNLTECLLIQSKHAADCPSLVPKLISNHLEDIASNRIRKLADRFGASTEDIQAAIQVIKRLNPRPGAAFHAGETSYIIPDVLIDKADGRFVIRIQDASAPRLSVDRYYDRMLKENGGDSETRSFLFEKRKSAAFFIKCIEQRRRTLYLVAQTIFETQLPFLQGGTPHLKPLTLKRISAMTGLHESTVSRTVTGKYALTPWGLFALKYFFSAGLDTDHGDSASSESVKAKIKEWVSQEDGRKPYSDRQLAVLLANQGIRISRRTVTKYREQLGISSSFKRKRQ